MQFQLLPVMNSMTALYQQPAGPERFRNYIRILEGGKKDSLTVPVSGFNPMAKDLAVKKLDELRKLNIEKIISETLCLLNARLNEKNDKQVYKVCFNLSDDLRGGWTNRFTTDYDSKFQIQALIKRNFCVPVFWTSEDYSEEMIIQRTLEYAFRTRSWEDFPNPRTLLEHIAQEHFVASNAGTLAPNKLDHLPLMKFYEMHRQDTDYVTIFNFMYGDDATALLGNSVAGITPAFAGFKFAAWLAANSGNTSIFKK